MAGPGAGEARLTLELEGHVYYTRALATGPQHAVQRLLKALPLCVGLMEEQLDRAIKAEKKPASGAES